MNAWEAIQSIRYSENMPRITSGLDWVAIIQEIRSRNIDSPINNGDDLLNTLMDEFKEVKGSVSSSNNGSGTATHCLYRTCHRYLDF